MDKLDKLRREAEEQEQRVTEAREAIEAARENWKNQLKIAIVKWKKYEREEAKINGKTND